ncbi:MAG: beta-carotene 15,15'-dioxygenase, Brp/Blh family [Microscillaceae bacterium]|nr:beta-carotene 15,15'-dioxygenase, Brp/Blh family [Microscillaceae bacterium]
MLLLLALALYETYGELPPWLMWSTFIGMMLVWGLPHGAVDHLVFQLSTASKSPYSPKFFRFYLGYMGLYALAWYIWPVPSFLFFLGMSAYHFGQSQLYFVALPDAHLLKKGLFLLWGASVLGAILMLHPDEVKAILAHTPFEKGVAWGLERGEMVLLLLVLSWSLWGLCIVLLKKLQISTWLRENILLGILLVFFAQTPLLLAFGGYFALWHSQQTILQTLKVFRRHRHTGYTFKHFYYEALPFSLLSYFGIGLLLGLYVWCSPAPGSALFLFFVLISILTAPHSWVIAQLYQEG